MIKNNLKPCPFCHCKVYKEQFEDFSISKCGDCMKHYIYKCPKCRIQFLLEGKTHDEIAEIWNNRDDDRGISGIRKRHAV